MNRSAPFVMTGITWAPASTSRRHTSMALYAAIPPLTPRTTRRPASAVTTSLARFVRRVGLETEFGDVGLLGHRDGNDLVGGDLLEADRQRLPGDRRDLGRHDGPEAVAQVTEVRVDLAGSPRRQGDEAEF